MRGSAGVQRRLPSRPYATVEAVRTSAKREAGEKKRDRKERKKEGSVSIKEEERNKGVNRNQLHRIIRE